MGELVAFLKLVAFLESLSGTEVIVEMPQLPDYVVQQFPTTASQVTAVSLKSGGFEAQLTPANTPKTKAPLGLAMTPKDKNARLTLVPKSTSPSYGKIMTLNNQRFILVENGDTLGILAEIA